MHSLRFWGRQTPRRAANSHSLQCPRRSVATPNRPSALQEGAVGTALSLLTDSLSDISLTVTVLSKGSLAASQEVMRLTSEADRRAEDVSHLARHLLQLLRAGEAPARDRAVVGAAPTNACEARCSLHLLDVWRPARGRTASRGRLCRHCMCD